MTYADSLALSLIFVFWLPYILMVLWPERWSTEDELFDWIVRRHGGDR